jgi:hypothetical protein
MKQRSKAVQLCFAVVLPFVFFATQSSAQLCPTTQVCALTWQQDTGTDIGAGYFYRTGQNLNEGKITAESFPSNFGQLCSVQLDGQVYAQPLIVANVTIHGYTGPVAYVVTENDTVYAIQATPPTSGKCNVVWSVSLLLNNLPGQPTMTAATCHDIGSGCATIYPQVGVLGTPVINIDSSTGVGTLYVVAEMESGRIRTISSTIFSMRSTSRR